ncbi:NAD(P)-binding protein [Heliocybe sulcata]|uniref:NAD(P)-binding protein n=1 Tax=Heliocybe sulcata TaxID=5364 RepID=A0A5C3MR44_9AGAM|nr:NAD(P)-binding protein [Heliocybe sulcata]
MSTMKNFVIAGVGRIGEYVAEEFLKLKASGSVSSLTVLTRSTASDNAVLEKVVKLGAQVTTVDYNAHDSLVSALTGVDAVVSALGGYGHKAQYQLADAAKAAGVKLFLPSEWGLYSRGVTDGFYAAHDAVHKHLEKIELPYALFYNGMWSDMMFNPYAGWNIPQGKITIWGEGNTPITWTTRRDAARFVAHLLTHIPVDQLAGKAFSVEGDRKTLNELVEGYTARTGKRLEVTHLPIAEQEKIMKEESQFAFKGIMAYLLVCYDRGAVDLRTTSPEGVANGLWPEWNPKPAVDVLVEAYP